MSRHRYIPVTVHSGYDIIFSSFIFIQLISEHNWPLSAYLWRGRRHISVAQFLSMGIIYDVEPNDYSKTH